MVLNHRAVLFFQSPKNFTTKPKNITNMIFPQFVII